MPDFETVRGAARAPEASAGAFLLIIASSNEGEY